MERVLMLMAQYPSRLQQLYLAKRNYISSFILVAADYTILLLAFELAQGLRLWLGETLYMADFYFPFQSWFLSGPLLTVAFIAYGGMYTKRLPFVQGAQRLFRAICFSICTTFALLFLSHMYDLSRLFLCLYGAIGFFFLLVERYLLKRVLVSSGLWTHSVLIIGAGKTATLLAEAFSRDKGIGYTIAGVIDDCKNDRPLTREYPYLGSFAAISSAIRLKIPDEVIIAAPGIGREKLLEILYQVQPLVKKVSLVPDLYGMPLANLEADTFFNQKVVLLKITNNLAARRNRILKRSFDFAVSIIGGLCISPILLAIALKIYVSNPGPVFFGHTRVGENGKAFKCYKFRSMIINAEEVLQKFLAENPDAKVEWEKDFKLKEDPRITPIGHFLRKTSLDELPQLWNVIRGEMSLVGPRPIVQEEVVKYGEYIQDFYMVRPGMTGFWQVSGRNDVTYDERVQMDSWYVRNWSLWMDMVMLVKTVGVVLAKKGAY